MIDSSFDEEYFRIENNISTNEQQFFNDREGRLVFTTPIFNEETIRSNQSLQLSNNIQPDNTNLIIDNITLISANPNVANYLPLKIRLDDKIKVEFPNVFKNTLADYRIVTEPPINLNTISTFSWGTQRNYKVSLTDQSPNDSTLNVVATPENIYSLDRSGRVERTVKSTGVVTQLAVTDVDRIFANRSQAVAISNETVIWNLIDDTIIFDYSTINETIVDIDLIGFDLYVTFRNTLNDDVGLNIWAYQDNDYQEIFEGPIYTQALTATRNFNSKTTRVSGGISDDSFLEFISFLSGGGFETLINTQLFVPIVDASEVFFGGSDITNPKLNIFSRTSTEIVWNIIDDWVGLQDANETIYSSDYKKIHIPFTPEFAGSEAEDVVIKNFLNNAYFINGKLLYVCNLDTGIFQTFPVARFPYEVRVINFETTGSQTYSKGEYGNPATFEGVITNRVQDRQSNEVYSLTYNYDQRAFPYSITNNVFSFELELPNNNSIIDMEIFKYVIDVRIRYTKQKRLGLTRSVPAAPSAPTAPSAENKKKFTKENTELSVEKVLGYVGPDFSIGDFLNIYKS